MAKVTVELPLGLAVCTIVEAELRYGIAKAVGSARQIAQLDAFLSGTTVLPFDSDAAQAYGGLRAQLERTGNLIGPNDLMIASIALTHGLTLITHNTAEFARVPGLVVEDWEQ